jgi:hypothetical protein
VLLAVQIGVFWKPSQPDRTFRFIRAAYVWLLISCSMMPFFQLYGALTHQIFAHTYMGSHHHAFTVGFISMMILGVLSRVVPIPAGIDAKRMNSLWAPFILFNVGCAGRVLLQVLTDFVPNVAYPLIAFTGFHRIDRVAVVGNRVVAHHERGENGSGEIAHGAIPATGTISR